MFKRVRRCTHAGRRQRVSDQEVQLNQLLVVGEARHRPGDVAGVVVYPTLGPGG